jgi:hypothetical protein
MEPEAILLGGTWEEIGVADPAVVIVVELDFDENKVRYESETCGGSMTVAAFRDTFRPVGVHKKWKNRKKGYIVTLIDWDNSYLRFTADDPKAAGFSSGRYDGVFEFFKDFEPYHGNVENTKTPVKAWELCDQANKTMQERGAQYDKDDKQEERSIGKVVQFFNTLKGTNLTEEDGWLFMAILKIVRSQQGDYSPDSYVDLVAYAALMGEAASNERK